jgi:hypothetical protein
MEGKADVGIPEVEEVKPDASGKYPESVSYSKYVGVKESIGKKLDAERVKSANLEEQLKKAPNAEEYTKIKVELDTTKAKLTEKEGELTKVKEATVSEMRTSLITKGIPEEKVKVMSEAEMKGALSVIGDRKPLPDLGSGGGSGKLEGSPMELARQAYSQPSPKK